MVLYMSTAKQRVGSIDIMEVFRLHHHFGQVIAYGLEFFNYKVLFHQEWSRSILKAIPHTATFINEGQELLISLLNMGKIMTLAADSSNTVATKPVHWPIGNATSNMAGNLILVQNMAYGFDLYKLPELIKTSSITMKTHTGIVTDVRFAENGSVAVGGSDAGKVVVMDLKQSVLIQELPHGQDWEAIQAVDTYSYSDCYLIASAGSTGSREPVICIWEKPTKLGVNRCRNSQQKVQLLLISLCILVFVFLIYKLALWREKVNGELDDYLYTLIEKAMAKEIEEMYSGRNLWADKRDLQKSNEMVKQAHNQVDRIKVTMYRQDINL
ncbi:uncharacterized protein EV420DRAFT_1653124 [Desarmillaria tabescens]|uniref:Uncharacterized protein n=1 Tax=Armillaria tabescens TaxID=1929756 RepID=A0AA39MJ12_ARMTA|nr:uncharacterized protein EV420DRAFT_1653124 [Desarmillaria tabescens]KAK0435454.1 hypothetical protein EV420DRAFT_1653124 [Desarmillaria tabescens]